MKNSDREQAKQRGKPYSQLFKKGSCGKKPLKWCVCVDKRVEIKDDAFNVMPSCPSPVIESGTFAKAATLNQIKSNQM